MISVWSQAIANSVSGCLNPAFFLSLSHTHLFFELTSALAPCEQAEHILRTHTLRIYDLYFRKPKIFYCENRLVTFLENGDCLRARFTATEKGLSYICQVSWDVENKGVETEHQTQGFWNVGHDWPATPSCWSLHSMNAAYLIPKGILQTVVPFLL